MLNILTCTFWALKILYTVHGLAWRFQSYRCIFLDEDVGFLGHPRLVFRNPVIGFHWLLRFVFRNPAIGFLGLPRSVLLDTRDWFLRHSRSFPRLVFWNTRDWFSWTTTDHHRDRFGARNFENQSHALVISRKPIPLVKLQSRSFSTVALVKLQSRSLWVVC